MAARTRAREPDFAPHARIPIFSPSRHGRRTAGLTCPYTRTKKSSESGLQPRSDSVRLSVLDAFFDTIRGACGNRGVPCVSLSWCKLLHIRVRARGETGRERSKCQQLREIGFMATLEPRSLACIDNPSETGMDFQPSDVLFGKAWFVALSWIRA